tara:strand:+ start:225 stop:1370 length:1146 start_codon:yes stop_codon:yes gene_type:complete
MDPKVLKMMQGASGASGAEKWEILAYTAHPKIDRTFSNYSPNWTTGYQDATTWFSNNATVFTGGSFNPSSFACDRFGRIGRGEFQTHTESDSGANNRTAAGDGDGFYSAAYNKTNLTKIALVGNEGTVDLSEPTNSTNHLVYDLVGTSGTTTDSDAGTGTYTLISLLQTLSAYNRNNTSWASVGTNNSHNILFNGPNCRDFTSGGGAQTQAGYSGLLSSSAGKMRNVAVSGDSIDTTYYPRFFCFWGINVDNDHDTQVCAAFGGASNSGWDAIGRIDHMGSLATQSAALKGDAFRGAAPAYTFWSLWGNDWHSDSQKQNISGRANSTDNSDYQGHSFGVSGTTYTLSIQSFPGTSTPAAGISGQDPNSYMCKQVYLLGYGE